MITQAETPLDPARRELQGLRRSLNTPVLCLEPLPVGPASAAIALHEDPAAAVTLALRSISTGRVVFYAPEEALDPEVALEQVVSFAEGLGFLFDDQADDAGPEPSQARRSGNRLRFWRRWLGEAPEDLAELHVVPEEPSISLSKFRWAQAVSPVAVAVYEAIELAAAGDEPDLCQRLLIRF